MSLFEHLAVCLLALVLGSDGWTGLDIGIFAAFSLSAPWTVMGFWNALIGFWLLHFVKDPVAAVSPFAELEAEDQPLVLRTAILMTLRNEDPSRAFLRLRVMRDSLAHTGEADRFDFYVLSDTDHAEVAAEEERLFAAWEAEFADKSRTLYRRRPRNASDVRRLPRSGLPRRRRSRPGLAGIGHRPQARHVW